MDKQSSFQDKVLCRLYGNTDGEEASPDNKDKIEDDSGEDKHIALTHTTNKVYTVQQAPPDWTHTTRETRTVSSDSSSSSGESSSGDDQPSCKRRRRRGKRLKRNPVTDNGEINKDSQTSFSVTQSTNDTDKVSKTLTKNQKRKLKKKRRNEKLKEGVENDLSKEFVYEGSGKDK